MIYKIGICDDEKVTCSELETIIKLYFSKMSDDVEIFVWNNSEEFMRDFPDKTELDILFLDIELPGKNGVYIGNYIREHCENEALHIIYISSKTSYAMELFKTHPYDFLIKPLDKEKVCDGIKKLLQLDEQDRRFFEYQYCRSNYKILTGDILYFESNRKHIKIVTGNGVREYVGKLKNECEKLPSNFVMIGQSFVVNLRHIKECFADHVVMDNGMEINISRNYRKSFNIKMIENDKRMTDECS
jgi:DNA-binding LytR/AlgR family response regulator